MSIKGTRNFWGITARVILRNRILILCGDCSYLLFLCPCSGKTCVFPIQKQNLLPDDHPVNLAYNRFVAQFGEEGNIIAIAVKDSSLFELQNFRKWNKLSKQLAAFPEVSMVLSTDNLKLLEKSKTSDTFVMLPFLSPKTNTQQGLNEALEQLFHEEPFYDQLLFNKGDWHSKNPGVFRQGPAKHLC